MSAVEFGQVRWGVAECRTPGCRMDAELLLDTLGPRCVGCADDYLERLQASAILGRPLEHGWFVFDDVVRPFVEWVPGDE